MLIPNKSTKTRLIPLKVFTPDSWADSVIAEPLVLLNDHAHLERKAATNALDLLSRWPIEELSGEWVTMLTAIAKDEVAHLALVARILNKRGGFMSRNHRNQYAADLHAIVRRGEGPREVIDRLLISALIELRSCERFEVLGRRCPDAELKKLYRSLWASEHGHFKTFLALASTVLPSTNVNKRWKEMLTLEAQIIVAQPAGSRMHSWIALASS